MPLGNIGSIALIRTCCCAQVASTCCMAASMLTTRDIQADFGLGGPAGSCRGAKIDRVCLRRALPSTKGTTLGDRGTREKEDMGLLLRRAGAGFSLSRGVAQARLAAIVSIWGSTTYLLGTLHEIVGEPSIEMAYALQVRR